MIALHSPTVNESSLHQKNTGPTLEFKAFRSAAATLAGIEVAYMIPKQRLQSNHISRFTQFVISCITA